MNIYRQHIHYIDRLRQIFISQHPTPTKQIIISLKHAKLYKLFSEPQEKLMFLRLNLVDIN